MRQRRTERELTAVKINPLLYATSRNVRAFWSHVERQAGEDGCWLWTAGRNKYGYGRFALTTGHRPGDSVPPQIHTVAHRLSFALTRGYWPELFILHRCDTPPCVNPNHLREGTQSENVQEAFDKGRKISTTRLSDQTVDDIRDLYYDGTHPRHIARLCGVSLSLVYNHTGDITPNPPDWTPEEEERYEAHWGGRDQKRWHLLGRNRDAEAQTARRPRT